MHGHRFFVLNDCEHGQGEVRFAYEAVGYAASLAKISNHVAMSSAPSTGQRGARHFKTTNVGTSVGWRPSSA
jgi:hypothetical protein